VNDPILPGATLGVLGSGQLGRMFAIAAARMGYHVHVYSPDSCTPAGEVSAREFCASYGDESALVEFAKSVDVVTFEFENVPSAVSEQIEKHALIRPSARVLNVCQNRLREKSTLQNCGLPVPEYCAVRSAEELATSLDEIGVPAVIKTASSGYDGKGQAVIRSRDEAASVWKSLKTDEAIVEQFVDFECEVSVVGARNPQGETAFYRPFYNTHRNHILDVTVCPAPLEEHIEVEATDIARSIFQELDIVGVACVELFVTKNGHVLINEIAPRPHNSGHLTIDAHVTCQFEQQVRAICGLPPGSVEQLSPAVMVNVLGDEWQSDTPNWMAMCDEPTMKLHLYGKKTARPGRKMGHITVLAESTEEGERLALLARNRLADSKE
jgi:5-(carboxyamino)imidazole ribonucleotide synthase